MPKLDTANAIKFSEFSDEQIVLLAKGGNEYAWEYIVEKYKNLVRIKSKPYFIIGASSEDIIQEGMIGLCKAIRDFKEDRMASFHSFADLCISRQIITAIKSSTRQKHIPLNSYISLNKSIKYDESERELLDLVTENYDYNPERIMIDKENLDGMLLKIEKVLSKFETRVLVYYLEGRSYNDISKMLDRDVKSIDNALCRVKRKLERALTSSDI